MSGKRRLGDDSSIPPPLGDHSSYMPEPLLVLADVRLQVKGGTMLPAHAVTLVQHCRTLARSSELLAGATPQCPVQLSSPFVDYEEDVVMLFLNSIYDPNFVALASAIAYADKTLFSKVMEVVRLAHTLDAASVLATAQRHLIVQMQQMSMYVSENYRRMLDVLQLADACEMHEVSFATSTKLVNTLQTPVGAMSTPEQMDLDDLDSFDWAEKLCSTCPPVVLSRVMGNLTANFRRVHAKASGTARNSVLSPGAAAMAAYASNSNSAIEVGGRFMALMSVCDEQPKNAFFESRGLEWSLGMRSNPETESGPAVGLALKTSETLSPKKVRYECGFLDLKNVPGVRADVVCVRSGVFTLRFQACWVAFEGLTTEVFLNPVRGLVANGLAAPFIRILEVTDATPEEVDEDDEDE